MTNGRTQPTEEPAAASPTGPNPTATDYGLAFSPRQVAGGFAIIAALLVLLVRRRRKKG
jgi:hypothetical protein